MRCMLQSGSAGPAAEPEALQRLLALAINEALTASSRAAEGASTAQEQQQQQQQHSHVLLIVVLPPAPGQPCGLDVRVSAHACAAAGSQAGTAIVLGGPRSVPGGKVRPAVRGKGT